MRELVAEQPPSGGRSGCILSRGKYHVVANRVSEGVDGSRGFGRARIRVHAHLAEVMTEAWLNECPGGGVEGLSGRAQDIVHQRRNAVVMRFGRGGRRLALQLFLTAFLAFS